jgi:hypothetical protein
MKPAGRKSEDPPRFKKSSAILVYDLISTLTFRYFWYQYQSTGCCFATYLYLFAKDDDSTSFAVLSTSQPQTVLWRLDGRVDSDTSERDSSSNDDGGFEGGFAPHWTRRPKVRRVEKACSRSVSVSDLHEQFLLKRGRHRIQILMGYHRFA